MREHSKTIHLLENVKVALASIDAQIEPRQVTDMDEMIRLQISGIPALLINEQIVSQKKVLTVPEIIEILRDQLKKKA